MRFPLAFFIILTVFFLTSCSCGDMDLGGGEEDVGQEDAGQTDMLPADFFWAPEIDNLGEPGWRESQDPWCAQVIYEDSYAYDVWSDSDGVYVLLRENPSWTDGRPYGCPWDCPNGKEAVFVNRGSGWSTLWEQALNFETLYGTSTLTGIQSGPVVTTSDIPGHGVINFIEEGVVTAQAGTEGAAEVFVVHENLVYTILQETDRILYYDGSSWGPLPVDGPTFAVYHLWADSLDLFLAGPTGTILSLEGSDWKVHDTRTPLDIESIWGFGGDDVWAGGRDAILLHYDGEAWTSVAWPHLSRTDESDEKAVTGMWGQDGVLFFHTSRQLTMWDGAGFTVLLLAEDDIGSGVFSIEAIWGNSPTELFVAVRDEAHIRLSCGAYYLLWWDGSEFHWF